MPCELQHRGRSTKLISSKWPPICVAATLCAERGIPTRTTL